MARSPRLQLTGAIYHVMSRGNRKGIIFEDDHDRRRFLEVLADAAGRYRFRCLSYCLMGNHYHLVIETADRNLSEAMHFVNGVYTQASNLRHSRTGHLLEGRFKSVVVDNDIYLWNANLYVVLNPVAAGLATHPVEWPWSSFRATAGLEDPPELLSLDWLDCVFGGLTREGSQRRYRELWTPLAAPLDDEDDVWGGNDLAAAVRIEIGAKFHQIRVPRAYKAFARPTLDDIFDVPLPRGERNALIVRAHVVHGYRLSEIAEAIRMHPNTLSRIVGSLRKRSV